MPYGFNKSLGGDSQENDSAIESCVNALMAKGADKVTAIRICKAARKIHVVKRRGGI